MARDPSQPGGRDGGNQAESTGQPLPLRLVLLSLTVGPLWLCVGRVARQAKQGYIIIALLRAGS